MATANDIIISAARRAGIHTNNSPLEADEVQDGLELLNDMLASWEPLLNLGFSPVANVSDEIRIPRETNAAVIDIFAVRLSPEYSKNVHPALAESARGFWKDLLNAATFIGDVDYPATLPLGSGNQCTDMYDWRFFPQKDRDNF